MKNYGFDSEKKRGRDTSRSINEHKRKRFPGSLSYLLIPVVGLVVAFFLIFSARDIFFSDKTPVYHKVIPENAKADAELPETTESGGAGEVSVDFKPAVKTEGDTDLSVKASPVKNDSPSAPDVGKFQDSDLWGIQIAMSASKEDSERLAAEVTKKGYNVQINQPGEYYRVRINGGPDQATAIDIERMLKDDGYDTLLVHSAPSGAATPPPPRKERAEFSAFQDDDAWGVQIGMFPVRADAMNLAGQARKQGFNPEVTKPGKYYRVRVKAGSDRQTAEKIENLLKKAGYDTLLVTS